MLWGVFCLLILFSTPSFSPPNTITIDFEPIGRICTPPNEGCDLTIQYSFVAQSVDTVGWSISYRFFGSQGIPMIDPFGSLEGEYPNYVVSGTYPIGDYTFLVEVSNAAGEELQVELPLEIVDCAAPIMTWIDTLYVPREPIDLDLNGRPDYVGLRINAEDFSSTVPFEECSGNPYFSIVEPGAAPRELDYLTMMCWDSFPAHFQVWTWDGADNPSALQPDSSVGGPNYTRREVVVIPQGGTPCDSLPIVNGRVRTENGKVFSGLGINAEGDVQIQTSTNEAGEYLLKEFTPDVTYRFTVDTIMDNPANGVSILDVSLLARHILNINPLSSPYKIIAGDVNNSGSLTTLDIVLIRLMIIGELAEFPGGTPSWRFVPSDYSFPPGTTPFNPPFREYRLLNNLRGFNEIDFVAIKMGDLNCSAVMP